MTKSRVLICPYCGDTQPASERCRSCSGLFEPLSRQATHNEMGPWYIRNEMLPFQPGCSYETLIKLIERGQVTRTTILRGPTTKQFWTIARRVPGVAHLLGYCHSCDASVDVGDHGCHACGVPFGAYLDRNYLGLPEIRPLPWEAPLGDEESRGEPAPPRTIDFRRAAEPLGISSFASDVELRGSAASGSGGAHFHSSHLASGTSPAGFGFVPVSASASMPTAVGPIHSSHEQQHPTAIAARAAQRRIEQQQRTIRLLVTSLIVLIVVAFITAAIALSNSFAPSHTGQDPPAAQRPAEQSSSVPASTPPADNPSVTPETDEESTSSTEIDVHAQLESVQSYISSGENREAPLSERIKAYESARSILQLLQSEPAAAAYQPEIAALIQSVERELYNLQVEQLSREPE